MVQVKVVSMAFDEQQKFPVVILQSLDGERRLPIWIGPSEASAIVMEINGDKFQRPLTHDLLLHIVAGLSARVVRVEIVELKESTFFARILLERESELISIDARPSDSIALALKAKAKIFVAENLFQSDVEALVQSEPSGEPPEPTEAERLKQLKAEIEGLNLKDFGRFHLP